jgi:hypothetical protein
VNDLDGSGLPFAGTQFGDAYEWDLTIGGNSSQTVQSFPNITHAVPEPSDLLLVSAAATCAVGWRRWIGAKLSPKT